MICINTLGLPFQFTFRPGVPLYEQVVYAAHKAIVSGELRPGDPFPSVRTLSRELKINPNTAQRVIHQLTAEGLVEVRPGIGTVVAELPQSSAAARKGLLGRELEAVVVEAKKLGMKPDDVVAALLDHWERLGGMDTNGAGNSRGRRKTE